MMPRRPSNFFRERSRRFVLAPIFARLLVAALFLFAPAAGAPAQSTPPAPPAASGVTIVLPPKVIAGGEATLAVLGADGKLASGVTVELENNPSVRTDRTGRGFFQVTSSLSGSGGVLIAHVSGDSGAVLVDSSPPVEGPQALSIATTVSLRDHFSICGSG